MSDDQNQPPPAAAPAPKVDNAASKEILDPTPSPAIVIEEDLTDVEKFLSASDPQDHTPRLKELLESSDPPSRFMTYLSIAFLLLALTCSTLLVLKYLKSRQSHGTVAVEEPKFKLEKMITESIGEYRLILKGASSPNDGELRVEMVAECSNQEACDYLKDHNAQTRDIVIPVLVNTTRAELLNPESKNLIRKRITEQLNSLPMKGKVIQILFTDLTIENAPDP